MLTGPETIEAMEAAFLSCDGDLPARAAYARAGSRPGPRRRLARQQSGRALRRRQEEYPHVDLKDRRAYGAGGQLRRVFEIAKRQLLPFMRTFPTRSNPLGCTDDAVMAMVAKSPGERGG